MRRLAALVAAASAPGCAALCTRAAPTAAQLAQWSDRKRQLGVWHGLWTTWTPTPPPAPPAAAAADDEALRLERTLTRAVIVHLDVVGDGGAHAEECVQRNRYIDPSVTPDEPAALLAAERAGQYTDKEFPAVTAAESRGRYAGPGFVWHGSVPTADGGLAFHAELGLVHGNERRRAILSYHRAAAGGDAAAAEAAPCPPLRLTSVVATQEEAGRWPSPRAEPAPAPTRPPRAPHPPPPSPTAWTHAAEGAPVLTESLPPTSAPERGADGGETVRCWEVAPDVRVLAPVSAHAGQPLHVELRWRARAPANTHGDAQLRARLHVHATPAAQHDASARAPPASVRVELRALAAGGA